jgi:hypothetical protein
LYKVQRPKIKQKKLLKEVFQYGGYFQNGVCTFFSYKNMSCDRCFSSIVLIFGLSHYFLTFNQTKINFRFVDHPNMGVSDTILNMSAICSNFQIPSWLLDKMTYNQQIRIKKCFHEKPIDGVSAEFLFRKSPPSTILIFGPHFEFFSNLLFLPKR